MSNFTQIALRDGTLVAIRPIAPDDETRMIEFHRELSESTVYHRYLQVLKLSRRVAHERLARTCFADIRHEIALVVEVDGAIIGVARLSRGDNPAIAELAIVIADRYQRQGLGRKLVERVLEIAKEEAISAIRANVLSDNLGMLRIFEGFGFKSTPLAGETVVEVEKLLSAAI